MLPDGSYVTCWVLCYLLGPMLVPMSGLMLDRLSYTAGGRHLTVVAGVVVVACGVVLLNSSVWTIKIFDFSLRTESIYDGQALEPS